MLRAEPIDDWIGLASVHGGWFVFAGHESDKGLSREIRGERKKCGVRRKRRDVLEIETAGGASSARLSARRVLQCRGKAARRPKSAAKKD